MQMEILPNFNCAYQLFIFFAFLSPQEGFPMKEEKVYPPWVLAICVLLALLPCVFVPLIALFHLIKRMRSSKDPNLVPPEVFSCQRANSNLSHPEE